MRPVVLPKTSSVLRRPRSPLTAGRAASIEDVVRAGVEALELRDQARYDEKLQKLQAAIDEGDASGTFEGDLFAHVRAKHGLSDR